MDSHISWTVNGVSASIATTIATQVDPSHRPFKSSRPTAPKLDLPSTSTRWKERIGGALTSQPQSDKKI